MTDDPTMQRLEDQITWYDQRSDRNQRTFKVLKILVIATAALIPFLAGLGVPAWAMGALGLVIAVAEGAQQLNQYHANWIAYRSTCEALKHEKFLYLGKAGPYAATGDPHTLLAERIESLKPKILAIGVRITGLTSVTRSIVGSAIGGRPRRLGWCRRG